MKNINQVSKTPILAIAALAFLLASCLSGGGGGSDAGSANSPTASAPTTCSSVTYDAPSGASNNIVFTFNKSYQCGRFANGDWWVSADASGFVTITSITPDGVPGKHGFEVNPANTQKQAFDDFDAGGAPGTVSYDATLMPALPLQVAGTSSVVKAVSIIPPPTVPKIQFAAVLTVLASPLANSTGIFRPAYSGGGASKTLYNVSSIQWGLVPVYPGTGVVPTFTIQDVALRYAGVRLDHLSSFKGRDLHPKDNMPDYGAQIATDNAAYLLRLALGDFDSSNVVHKQALINYLQMAIDLKGMATNGTKWNATGGHSIGRKLPLAIAAKILNNPDFTTAIAASLFDEDLLIYRSAVTTKVLYGQSGTDAQYWLTTQTTNQSLVPPSVGSGARDVRDPYGYIDGGGYEIGNTIGYQYCCTAMPWKYTALAVDLFGIAPQFNNALLPEYVSRWVTDGVIAAPDPRVRQTFAHHRFRYRHQQGGSLPARG
jgi:hypothetical protein